MLIGYARVCTSEQETGGQVTALIGGGVPWYPRRRLPTVGRSSLKNLADPGLRRLLNRVKQLVAFDGHIEVWADGLSFANAFSHPHVQLRNVERKPRRDRGWNSAIALRYREIRQRFARLRTAHGELGDLYVS